MILGYWATRGKIPIGTEENRTLYSFPPDGDYCAVFETGSIVIVDVDDYNHQTGEIDDPVRGKPRSEAVIEFLNSCNYRYNGIRTEKGVHLEFRFPSGFEITANKNNWFCPLGVKIEVKVTKPVELVVVNGIERRCFKGSIGDSGIDELPPALWPIQKSRDKPFSMDFSAGDRNNRLSAYALHLPKHGISAEETVRIVRSMNQFILEDPLDDSEIDLILREETLQKIRSNEQFQQEKNLTQVQIGKEVIDHFGIVTVQGQMYRYRAGVYLPVEEDLIGSYIRKLHPTVKTSLKNESLDYIADVTFRETVQEENHLVNVRNGLLDIGADGTVSLYPHSKEIISFRQFHAVFDPAANSDILKNTLNKFFDQDQEQIYLFKQLLGYLLMNHTDFQKAFFFVGSPSSGKSKILNMITAFCGRENVSNLTLKELDDRFRAVGIVGKSANINADLEKAKILTSGNFKSFVTGDAVTLERKYGKPFSYGSTAKLIFASNQFPDFSKDPEGIHRRVIVFPCNHVFSKTAPDFNPRIDQDLQSEETLSTVLNMAVEGYTSLIKQNGFIATKATEQAVEDFRCDLNNVYRWVKETEKDAAELLQEPIRLDSGGLYMDYMAFCISAGEEAKPQREFSRSICQEFGFATTTKRHRYSGKRCQYFTKKK